MKECRIARRETGGTLHQQRRAEKVTGGRTLRRFTPVRLGALEGHGDGFPQVITAMASILAVILLLVSCGQQGERGPEEEESASRAIGVSIAGITDNPAKFYGETVTVSGTVAKVLEPNAFMLVGDGPASNEKSAEDEAVVVVADDRDLNVTEGHTVKVTGTLRRFNLAALEEDVGADLDNE